MAPCEAWNWNWIVICNVTVQPYFTTSRRPAWECCCWEMCWKKLIALKAAALQCHGEQGKGKGWESLPAEAHDTGPHQVDLNSKKQIFTSTSFRAEAPFWRFCEHSRYKIVSYTQEEKTVIVGRSGEHSPVPSRIMHSRNQEFEVPWPCTLKNSFC